MNVSADQRDPPQSHRPFHIQLRNVAANQGNHPLSAALHCWHILDCGIGCWLHILIGMPGFVMKYVSLRTYLHARECHHVFNNRDQSLVPCFILFSEHQRTLQLCVLLSQPPTSGGEWLSANNRALSAVNTHQILHQHIKGPIPVSFSFGVRKRTQETITKQIRCKKQWQ